MRLDLTSGYGDLSRKIRVAALVAILASAAILSPVSLATGDGSSVPPLMDIRHLQTIAAKEVVLVDTRPAWKYLLGHIPGAVNLKNWEEFTETRDGVRGLLIVDTQFIANKLRLLGVDGSKTIVIYGEPKDPWRTDGRFFWMFQYFGFKKVALLEGGFDHWAKEHLPVERGTGKSTAPSALTPADIHFNDDIFADQNWIFKRLGSPSLIIIDNRTRAEFDGSTIYNVTRGGHIPGAIHIDWRDFFTEDGLLKNRETLLGMLKGYGIRKEQDIVVYCTGGVRSAMAYFVLHYLEYKVRNYDGSWWDWSHNLSLPAEM